MTTRAQQEANDTSQFSDLIDALGNLRNPTSLLLIIFGISLILAGYLIQFGVWAAILPIWGGAAVLFGLAGYLYVWWTHRVN